jgi:hypothetical protein
MTKGLKALSVCIGWGPQFKFGAWSALRGLLVGRWPCCIAEPVVLDAALSDTGERALLRCFALARRQNKPWLLFFSVYNTLKLLVEVYH